VPAIRAWRARPAQPKLDDMQCPWRATRPHRVDRYDRIQVPQQITGEMNAAIADLAHDNARREGGVDEATRDFDAEAVVSKCDISHSGHEDAPTRGASSTVLVRRGFSTSASFVHRENLDA
jgi:hypothetical protein